MRRRLFRWRSRAHARQARLDRLRQNEGTLLDRLYGTAYEGAPFPPTRDFDARESAEVLRFVLRLGRELFLAGASTRDIQTAVVAVTAAWGMQELEVDISGRSLQVQYAPPERAPVVMLIVLGSEDTRDLSSLTALERLTVRIVGTQLSPADAKAALDRLVQAPAQWPWWFALCGGAVLAAMLCVLASGTVRAALLAPLLFLVTNRAAWALSRTGLPSFYVTVVQTALLMAGTMALIDFGVLSGREGASTVAANVILMLPILTVVSLTEDAIDGFRSMAAARSVSLLMFFAAMAGGLLTVAFLLRGLDSDARDTTLAALPVWLTLVTSGIGALGNAVFMGGGPRLVPWAMAAALIGAGVKMCGTAQLDWSVPLATGLATIAMGAVSAVIGPRAAVPARAVLIPGIAGSVLPGPDLYRSVLQLVLGVPGAHQYLVLTLASVAAIGVGAVLGSLLGAGSERKWSRRSPGTTRAVNAEAADAQDWAAR
ncbi:threonine/serine exporter family protein [Streptomyces sp. NPDC048442]|uniref:threonine/serine exporter family protein n=1 Tax=Streptomyces sp. NPDC048442 TaxID=3154823 RepID=UPI00342D6E34